LYQVRPSPRKARELLLWPRKFALVGQL
jgi:hypothetical protein